MVASRLAKLEEMQPYTVRQNDATEGESEGLQNSEQVSNDKISNELGNI